MKTFNDVTNLWRKPEAMEPAFEAPSAIREAAEAFVESAILCEQAIHTGKQPEEVTLPKILTQPLL